MLGDVEHLDYKKYNFVGVTLFSASSLLAISYRLPDSEFRLLNSEF
jgi:hypothetical protein